MKLSQLLKRQYIWHQIKLIRYKALILKVVLVKFGAYNITQRLLMKKMVDIIKFRKDALIKKRNMFKNEEELIINQLH